jgi:RNA-directed DNA polymerase
MELQDMKNNIDEHQRMALSQNTHVYMETMEETQNEEKKLIKLGVPEYYAQQAANSRKKYWYVSAITKRSTEH